MKKFLVVVICAFLTGCSLNPFGTSPSPSDTISYVAIGTNIVGSVLIDYSTPTNGVISTNSTLVTPFSSGSIAGYSQFISTKPNITVTIINTGCVELQIRKNAEVVKHDSKCGPTTFSVAY